MTPPKMTYQQQQDRALQKRALLLNFLGGGEVYSSVSILSDLLQIKEQTIAPMLKRMVGEKLLRVDENPVPFSRLKLFGITAHGIAVTAAAHPACREFRPGTISPNYIEHHLAGQRVRLLAERAGWKNWVPGKLLYTENEQRLKKIPDGLATRPDGRRVAIEIEREVKSLRRLSDAMGGHLQQIVGEKYDLVYYFSPQAEAQTRAFKNVLVSMVGGEKVKITDGHRARFRVLDLKNPVF